MTLLTVLLSCLKEGAAHSRTHTHTLALMKRSLYTSTNTFMCTTKTNFILSIHFTPHTHERALTHLNACTCLPVPTHSLTQWLYLPFLICNVYLSPFLSSSLSFSLPLLEGHFDKPPHKERHTIPADSRGSPSEGALPVASVH